MFCESMHRKELLKMSLFSKDERKTGSAWTRQTDNLRREEGEKKKITAYFVCLKMCRIWICRRADTTGIPKGSILTAFRNLTGAPAHVWRTILCNTLMSLVWGPIKEVLPQTGMEKKKAHTHTHSLASHIQTHFYERADLHIDGPFWRCH